MRLLTYPQRQKRLLYTGKSNARRWRSDPPPLTHAWGGCLITDILEEAWLEDQITKAIVFSLEEAILFFGRHSKNEGPAYCRARNVEFGLGVPVTWAQRSGQTEVLRKTIQEGHYAIHEAVVEKKMKARGPWQPWEKTRHPKTPAAAYEIEEWMQDLVGDSDGELQ